MKHIARCLNPKLVTICEKTIQLETLNLMIIKYLPPELHTHCHVGSFNQGCLVLVIDDPSWATQLRFMLPELRDNLRIKAGLYQLSSIKITIFTPPKKQHNKKTAKRELSLDARSAINKSAEDCSYPPLQQALYNLGAKL